MPLQDLFVIYLIQFLLLILPSFGLSKLFEKAGLDGKKAYIPLYNTLLMQEKAKRPTYWVWLQLVPIVGWFITMGIYIEWVKLFGKFSFAAHALASLFPMFYFPYLASHKDTRYVGPEIAKNHKKGSTREWVDAGIFAIVAATLIRTFIFEAYTIPTGSMEKTLLINDFLFVSKFSYGPRIPNTPLSVPFIHANLPGSKAKSYSELIKIPYTRWFASPVKRNDVVVFNFPAGDTVTREFESATPYYDIVRQVEANYIGQYQQQIPDKEALTAFANESARRDVWGRYEVITRPVDKRENYIKRCVGISGDTVKVINDEVYINSVRQPLQPNSQARYIVVTGGQAFDADVMKEEYNLEIEKGDYEATGRPNEFRMLLTNAAREKMLKNGLLKSAVIDFEFNTSTVYPYDSLHKWTRDNYGPIWIPQKGATITLTPENFNIYERAIRVYEGNDLQKKNGKLFINGQETNQYTFKMNYYWMMGDNRMDSQDSRYWGFVPEDHIVGEASLIWMSWEKGVRWSRLFRTIH